MKNPLCIEESNCINSTRNKACRYKTAADTCVHEDGPETSWEIKKELKRLRVMHPERLFDLVRWARSELHEAKLITDEEYAMLVREKGSVKRLESYDELAARLKEMEKRVKDGEQTEQKVLEQSKEE